MKTQKQHSDNPDAPTCLKPLLADVLFLNGWNDEDIEKPKKDGQYLCLCKWYTSDVYNYQILEFTKKKNWIVSDSCEHIWWKNISPSPFIK